MNISFFKCGDDPKMLNKNFISVTTADCVIYGENSKSSPRIKIVYDPLIMSCNYLYIAEFGRYYSFTIDTKPNGSIELVCTCDYYASYKNDILRSKAHITRSHTGNKYIPDSMATQTNEVAWQFKDLGTCFVRGGSNYVVLKGGIL